MNRAVIMLIISIFCLCFFSGCIFPEKNLPPEPYLKASSTFIHVNQTVVFSANDSFDEDGEIVKYFWDFDDGSNASGKYVTHYYEKGGNYTVILIITDNDGEKAVQAMIIHVNELPKPNIVISMDRYIHEPIYFWANDTYDPDGYVTDYYWDFGDGTNDTGPSVSHIYSEKTNFTVTLTVTDNDGGKAARSKQIEVIYRTYEVTWDTGWLQLGDPDEDYLEEGNSEYLTKEIDIMNITKLEFILTWVDDWPFIGDPPLTEPEPNDEFILNITSPNNDMFESDPETDEKIVVKAPDNGVLNAIPAPFQMQAESKDILEMQIAEQYTKSNGTGEWAINITLTEAGGSLGLPTDVDDGNDWTLEIIYYYYYPVVTPK